jgi:hypothetical protein
MRQLLALGLVWVVLGGVGLLCGCGADNRGQAEFPKNPVAPPKGDPTPVGGGKAPAPSVPKEGQVD